MWVCVCVVYEFWRSELLWSFPKLHKAFTSSTQYVWIHWIPCISNYFFYWRLDLSTVDPFFLSFRIKYKFLSDPWEKTDFFGCIWGVIFKSRTLKCIDSWIYCRSFKFSVWVDMGISQLTKDILSQRKYHL